MLSYVTSHYYQYNLPQQVLIDAAMTGNLNRLKEVEGIIEMRRDIPFSVIEVSLIRGHIDFGIYCLHWLKDPPDGLEGHYYQCSFNKMLNRAIHPFFYDRRFLEALIEQCLMVDDEKLTSMLQRKVLSVTIAIEAYTLLYRALIQRRIGKMLVRKGNDSNASRFGILSFRGS